MLNKLKKWFKSLKSSIRYNYSFLGVLNSPFRRLKLTWYFGKIDRGTPYFLPRKLVKMSKERAIELANNELNHPHYPTKKSFEELVTGNMKCKMFVPIKYFGYHFTTLGWKTKWTNTDFRFEWSPSISIVLFGKQLFISFVPKMDSKAMLDCYWESWLFYSLETDKSKSQLERIKETIDKHGCTWIHYKDGNKVSVNHYKYILKDKYLHLIID